MARLEQITALVQATFPDQDVCKTYLPCKAYLASRHRCSPKGYQFSVLVGTEYEDTAEKLASHDPSPADRKERHNQEGAAPYRRIEPIGLVAVPPNSQSRL